MDRKRDHGGKAVPWAQYPNVLSTGGLDSSGFGGQRELLVEGECYGVQKR